MTYEELRKWIVGINALLQNKNQLMRLSSNIVTINNWEFISNWNKKCENL